MRTTFPLMIVAAMSLGACADGHVTTVEERRLAWADACRAEGFFDQNSLLACIGQRHAAWSGSRNAARIANATRRAGTMSDAEIGARAFSGNW